MSAAITVDGLGKRYRVAARERYGTLRDSIARSFRAPLRVGRAVVRWRRHGRDTTEHFWALRHVGFEVEDGEVLGVVGRNGAGKSTLLKLLCRITEPTEGRGEIRGRVGSLLEVGTGFHPELTGRENIYLNGAILGMRRAETARKFDEIVDFAGVERFIDTPVKRYSSGMHMRLAFAVAAHLETEILLVDEVLAVGDAAFQLKCLNKMSEVSGSGKTILFVSHNMEAVAKLCTRGLVLDRGQVVYQGLAQDCVNHYLESERAVSHEDVVSLREHRGRLKDHGGAVRLTSLLVTGGNGERWRLGSGEPMTMTLSYEVQGGVQAQEATFAFTVSNLHNQRLFTCRSHDTYLDPIRAEGSGTVTCAIERLPLGPGVYKLSVGCNTESGFSDGVYDAVSVEVAGLGFYPGGSVPHRTHGEVLVDHTWRVAGNGPQAMNGE